MAVPVDVIVQFDLQLVQRREALPADGLGLQHPVRRLAGRVAVRAALPREGPFDSGCPQETVDSDAVEFAALVGMTPPRNAELDWKDPTSSDERS